MRTTIWLGRTSFSPPLLIKCYAFASYPEPDVICRYFSNNGIAVSGYYNSNDNLFYDCPAAATSHGPCNGAPAAKRSFGKSLSPLEQCVVAFINLCPINIV